MCVIGNPPYSGISQIIGQWIADKIEDYKYIDGVHFGERKHWLQDDHVKFLRLAEYMIEQNGEGVLDFITNHGYLDSPTFRGMRWHLMQTFDHIHVLDLHGNANKKEVSHDGSPDKNVFDLTQGVAIIIAVSDCYWALSWQAASHSNLTHAQQGYDWLVIGNFDALCCKRSGGRKMKCDLLLVRNLLR